MATSNAGTCFVVQGFGKKTDYTDGRVLDLDASYEVIKEAVESAGLQCVRADDIIHSGTIDVPMYQQLLHADLVIADLSTYNVNAAFELGVRYALRPRSTIVLAEEKFQNPFDLGHVVIRRYRHLGEEIGYREAKRLREMLCETIQQVLAHPKPDSPVYTFIPRLVPPSESALEPKAAFEAARAGVDEAAGDTPSAKGMLDLALTKIHAEDSDFTGARVLLEEVRKLRPHDPFVIQQLALATYKSGDPDAETSLRDARDILLELEPETSNDPETVGLWGAIQKRHWDLTATEAYLDGSINAYERGFLLKQDHYNGINLAFLLSRRALEFLKAANRDEAVADWVAARRVRKEVVHLASPLAEGKDLALNRRYWAIATLWEASLGLEDEAAAAHWEAQARAMPVADWMQETREKQGRRLKELMQAYAELSETAP